MRRKQLCFGLIRAAMALVVTLVLLNDAGAAKEKVLYSFTGGSDGSTYAGLIL